MGAQLDWTEIAPRNLHERALGIATQEVSNLDGSKSTLPRVVAMLRYATSRPGQPWNAAFVSWCLGHAGFNLQCIPYPAAANSWIGWAESTGRLRTSQPVRGDLFVFNRPGRKHIGFVLDVKGDRISTLEGDVSPDGRLEGGQGALLIRNVESIDGYIKLGA